MWTQNETTMLRLNQQAGDAMRREARLLRQLRVDPAPRPIAIALACRGLSCIGRWLEGFGRRLSRLST